MFCLFDSLAERMWIVFFVRMSECRVYLLQYDAFKPSMRPWQQYCVKVIFCTMLGCCGINRQCWKSLITFLCLSAAANTQKAHFMFHQTVRVCVSVLQWLNAVEILIEFMAFDNNVSRVNFIYTLSYTATHAHDNQVTRIFLEWMAKPHSSMARWLCLHTISLAKIEDVRDNTQRRWIFTFYCAKTDSSWFTSSHRNWSREGGGGEASRVNIRNNNEKRQWVVKQCRKHELIEHWAFEYFVWCRGQANSYSQHIVILIAYKWME